MNILIVNTYYYPEIIGGAEISVKKLAENLAIDNNVYILCSGKNDKKEVINGVNVIRFKPYNIKRRVDIKDSGISMIIKIIRKALDVDNRLNDIRLLKIVKEVNPDIIHTNGLYEITPAIWRVGKKLCKPIIHTFRDYYLFCEKATMTCKKTNNCDGSSRIRCSIRKKYSNWLLKRYVDTFTTPSEHMKKKVEKSMSVVLPGNVIYNAIDFNINDVEEKCKRHIDRLSRADTVRFIYIGALEEHKGIQWLVSEFMNIKSENVELHIAGKGQLKKWITEQVNRDKRIHFHGFLEEISLLNILNNTDILIAPSLWDEPFGRVVLDAYKSGIPVISTNMGALPEIVNNNVTGLVVSYKNGELQNAMEKIANNKQLILKYINNIPRTIAMFDITMQKKKYLELYESIVKLKLEKV